VKIICSKESLIKILSIAESVISTKNSISILSNVLFETVDDKIKISACENTLNFFAELSGEIYEKGSISVYSNRLYSIIRKLDGDEIEINSDSQNNVTIRPKDKDTSKYSLKGIEASKFPPIKIPDSIEFFSIKQEVLTEMTKKTIFAISLSESRRFVSGILFEKIDNSIRMVSTDGKRLAYIKKEIESETSNYTIIVPPKILNEVLKLSTGNGDINIGLNNKNIYIKINNFCFISNLLEGNFPPYEKVIPKDQPKQFIVNKKDFFNSIDRISLIGDKESHKIILSLSNGFLNIFSENIAFGHGEEIIPIEYNDENFEIALNYIFITDVLPVLNSEKIIVQFKDSQNTITIKELGNDDYTYIMMPMSL